MAAAALHGVYSHNSRGEPNMAAPVDGGPYLGDPGPGQEVTS